MRTFKTLIIAALVLGTAGTVFAELQNVEIGGKLRIRGNYYNWDNSVDNSFVEQRTLLNVKADFTSDVSAFIELDSYGVWGEDFRSLYLTGADGRANSGDDVEVYQAYIDAKNLWGTPLSLRVGRQELVFGSKFLLGSNDSAPYFTGLSYDALRLTFANDIVKVDAFAAKLAETAGDFGQDDINLYGVYGSYLGIEDVTIDAYWLYLQDDDVLLGDNVDIHTVGLRGNGKLGSFDFEAEIAYQFGEQDGQPSACPFGFGEADVDYGTFGGQAILGYTFDVAWQPRVFGLFAYYGAGDADTSFWSNDRTLPFNRLFSDLQYSDFVDLNSNATNVIGYALGLQLAPTESLGLLLAGKFLDLDDNIGKQSSWGWEVNLAATYHYSEDLTFSAGYSHFFGSDWDQTKDCPVYDWDGDQSQDYDYVFVQAEISF